MRLHQLLIEEGREGRPTRDNEIAAKGFSVIDVAILIYALDNLRDQIVCSEIVILLCRKESLSNAILDLFHNLVNDSAIR